MKVPIIIIFCLLTAPAWARLNETKAQVDARYGKEHILSPDLAFYIKDGIRVWVHYHNGRAASIFFVRPPAENRPLTPLEISTLLKANSLGKEWRLVSNKAGVTEWHTHDSEIIATYVEADNFLMIRNVSAKSETGKRKNNTMEGF